MARAAAAWASAIAHDAHYLPAFSAQWMHGTSISNSLGNQAFLKSSRDLSSGLVTTARWAAPAINEVASQQLSSQGRELRGSLPLDLLGRWLH
jgi:hypothetical protein